MTSETDSSINMEDLTGLGKNVDAKLKQKLSSKFNKKQFHEKFHEIDKFQNKEIDKKVIELEKKRNVGQIKYLVKKRVSSIKNNLENVKIKLGNLDDELDDPDRSGNEDQAENYFLKKSKKKKEITNEEFIQKFGNKNKNEDVADKKMMKNAFARFQKKYGVNSEEDMLKVIEKIGNKETEEKFSKFLQFFRQKQKARPKIQFAQNTKGPEKRESEMLNEINNFVASKDFNNFFETVIQKPRRKLNLRTLAEERAKFNRKPKNVVIRRSSGNARLRAIKANSETRKTNSLTFPRTISATASETRSIKKKIAIRLVEFTCELLDIPSLKKRFMKKKRKNKKKGRRSKSPQKSSPIPKSRLSSPPRKSLKKIDPISEEKSSHSFMKSSIKESEMDSPSKVSSSLSDIIIKIRQKPKMINRDVKEMEQKVLYHQGYAKYIKTQDRRSTIGTGLAQALKNLKHFRDDSSDRSISKSPSVKSEKVVNETGDLKESDHQQSSRSVSSDGEQERQMLKIPAPTLKRFEENQEDKKDESESKTPRKKKIVINKFKTVSRRSSKHKSISQGSKNVAKFNQAVKRIKFSKTVTRKFDNFEESVLNSVSDSDNTSFLSIEEIGSSKVTGTVKDTKQSQASSIINLNTQKLSVSKIKDFFKESDEEESPGTFDHRNPSPGLRVTMANRKKVRMHTMKSISEIKRNPRLAKKMVKKASTKTSTKNLLRKFSSQKSMPKVVAKENPKTCRLLNIKFRQPLIKKNNSSKRLKISKGQSINDFFAIKDFKHFEQPPQVHQKGSLYYYNTKFMEMGQSKNADLSKVYNPKLIRKMAIKYGIRNYPDLYWIAKQALLSSVDYINGNFELNQNTNQIHYIYLANQEIEKREKEIEEMVMNSESNDKDEIKKEYIFNRSWMKFQNMQIKDSKPEYSDYYYNFQTSEVSNQPNYSEKFSKFSPPQEAPPSTAPLVRPITQSVRFSTTRATNRLKTVQTDRRLKNIRHNTQQTQRTKHTQDTHYTQNTQNSLGSYPTRPQTKANTKSSSRLRSTLPGLGTLGQFDHNSVSLPSLMARSKPRLVLKTKVHRELSQNQGDKQTRRMLEKLIEKELVKRNVTNYISKVENYEL